MDEIVMRSQTNWENMWSQKPKKGIGKGKPEEGISAVWDWPEFPYVKQKLVHEKRFTSNWDIEGVGLSTKGAHMPIIIYTCGTCLRSPKAETQRRNARKTRLAEAKLKAPSKHRRSQNPEDDILGFDADAAESSGIAAVAAEPGPAWVASEPGPAAVAPEAGLDQGPPENLPIGTANFFQPRDTEQQRMDNAIQQHYERMAGIAAHSPGECLQEKFWPTEDAFELAMRWYMYADTHPEFLLLRSLDAFEHSDDDDDFSWMTR